MRHWSFVKGHGTENDFVILLDRGHALDLGPDEVRFLCNRRAGVGADGVLRAVLSRSMPDAVSGKPGGTSEPGGPQSVASADEHLSAPLWFMDYRNADGSLAEMCGNGIRVFARYLLTHDLVQGPTFDVLTRSGVRRIEQCPDGQIRVGMGSARLTGADVSVQTRDGLRFAAVGVDVGNPHAVSFVDDVPGLDLADIDLHSEPSWLPAASYPDGVNREFVAMRGDRWIAMRVFERGSGETRSCGTGTVAAALAAQARMATADTASSTWRVDVPGGTVTVELTADQAYLTGPAVLVAHGEVAVPTITHGNPYVSVGGDDN